MSKAEVLAIWYLFTLLLGLREYCTSLRKIFNFSDLSMKCCHMELTKYSTFLENIRFLSEMSEIKCWTFWKIYHFSHIFHKKGVCKISNFSLIFDIFIENKAKNTLFWAILGLFRPKSGHFSHFPALPWTFGGRSLRILDLRPNERIPRVYKK